MSKVFVKTFGCRTNIVDSELIKAHLDKSLSNDEASADTIIINACTVTNGADSDVRNYVNRMSALGKKVLFTGCGFESRGRELMAAGKVFGVFSPSKKAEIKELISRNSRFFENGSSDFVENHVISGFSKHSKGFVKIQEGCDFSCSYCIIPSVRGKSRSMSEEFIIAQAKELIANGYTELVLTGTNIGSYGKDSGSSLGLLLQKLGALNGLKRIRLGSIEPSQIDNSFKECFGESWLERHLHIALQHTSQAMLNIMRRANKAHKDKELFLSLADMGFALGTDFIVAHPGESEQIWTEGLEAFKALPITHLHAFIYSKRDGTRSASMSQPIPNAKLAKERLNTLKQIASEHNLEFRKKKQKLDVFCEQKGKDGLYHGFDQFYNKIAIESNTDITKQWLEIDDYEIRPESNFAKINR